MKYKFDLIQNGYTICPDSWGMKNESAVFHRIYYVYGGEAWCSHGGKEFRLTPGRLWLFPVMQPYTLWQNTARPLDVLWFHAEIEGWLCLKLTSLEVTAGSSTFHLLEALKELGAEPEHFEELKKVFGVFLSLAAEQLPGLREVNGRMQSVLEYINRNTERELTVEALAEYAGMDRSYFSRKFKSLFHMPPNQYLLAKRLNAAALRLTAGASVYEAARAAGYADEKAFSRAFKNYMEIPPGEYRKSHIVQP